MTSRLAGNMRCNFINSAGAGRAYEGRLLMTIIAHVVRWSGWRCGSRAFLLLQLGTALALFAASSPAQSGNGDTAPGIVAVIDRTAIEMSGLTSLSELLSARWEFNVFGMRGAAGGDGVSYLIDGRPVASLDLDLIPVSAVERIEIRSEGATRYSPFSAGGTANIVLRRVYKGGEISAGIGRPTAPGGDANHESVVWGGAMGRGHIVVGVDHIRRDEVRDSQRDYTRAKYTPGGPFSDTQAVSRFGNTLIFVPKDDDPADGNSPQAIYSALGDCDEGTYTGLLSHALGEVCGYSFADIKWHGSSPTSNYIRRGRESLFVNADHPLSDTADFHVNARTARQDTAFRYAPAAGEFEFEPRGDVKTRLIGAAEALTEENFPTAEDGTGDGSVRVSHRFVGHGNRDWRTDYEENVLGMGVRGRLDNGLGYNAHLRYYRSVSALKGSTFVSTELIRAAIEAGRYNIADPLSTDPEHLAAIRETSLRLDRDQVVDHRTARFDLDGVALSLPGGDIRWTAGLEVNDQQWQDVYDYRDSENLSHDPTDALGTAGSSSVGDRLRVSALAEASLLLLAGWDLTLAGRHDDYDDVGTALSWRAVSRYRLNDAVALRVSLAGGASPPGLSDLHSQRYVSYPRVCDTPDGADERVCVQLETESGGNPKLKPNDWHRIGVGVSADSGPFSLTADWFRVEISDTPATMNAQSAVDLYRTGKAPAGVEVEEQGGHIVKIVNPIVQAGESETEGIALKFGAAWETDLAAFNADVHALHTLHSESRVAGVKSQFDFPRDRVHAALRVSRGDVIASWNVHVVSGYWNGERTGRWGGWTGHDLALQWRGTFGLDGLKLTGGVLNVGDREPALNPANLNEPALTYDSVRGRTFFLNASMSW